MSDENREVTVHEISLGELMNDDGSFNADAVENKLHELFDQGRNMVKTPVSVLTPLQRNALNALIPLIDAGIDVIAMEGAIKAEEFNTLEAQMFIRRELVGSIYDMLNILSGATVADIEREIDSLENEGWSMKQDADEVEDRLKVWDKLTITNMLYGPRKAGELLAKQAPEKSDE